LYITAAATGNAKIYNLTGSVVKTIAIAAGQTAATSLPTGIYVVVPGDGKTYKVVVK
jgi:hypothetical protein